MKGGLDTKFKKKSLCAREFTATEYVKGLKMLDQMNEMAGIERVKDTLEYCEEHPYWRLEHTDKYLALVEANIALLREIWPWKEDEKKE